MNFHAQSRLQPHHTIMTMNTCSRGVMNLKQISVNVVYIILTQSHRDQTRKFKPSPEKFHASPATRVSESIIMPAHLNVLFVSTTLPQCCLLLILFEAILRVTILFARAELVHSIAFRSKGITRTSVQPLTPAAYTLSHCSPVGNILLHIFMKCG